MLVNNFADDVSVLLGNGDGTFQAARHFGVGTSPHSVAVGDFNGDGLPDLAVANWYSSDASVLINDVEPRRGALPVGRADSKFWP